MSHYKSGCLFTSGTDLKDRDACLLCESQAKMLKFGKAFQTGGVKTCFAAAIQTVAQLGELQQVYLHS